jgi:hypothetical protein
VSLSHGLNLAYLLDRQFVDIHDNSPSSNS